MTKINQRKTKTGASAIRIRESRLEQAQQLMYDAWEIGDRKRRVALAQKALSISPDCADAYVLLAEESSALDAALELYRKGVEAGEHAIGRRAFETLGDDGYFWGVLETRPYMRARAGLARCLWEKGQHDEAIAHYREMLRLNPNDNQGLRYVIVSCLLELRREEQVKELLAAYPDDAAAEWPWTEALLVFREQGDTPAAREKLADALKRNPHVPTYVLGHKKLPRQLPDLIGFGDDSEAVSYAAEHLDAWKATPGALSWLAQVLSAETI